MLIQEVSFYVRSATQHCVNSKEGGLKMIETIFRLSH